MHPSRPRVSVVNRHGDGVKGACYADGVGRRRVRQLNADGVIAANAVDLNPIGDPIARVSPGRRDVPGRRKLRASNEQRQCNHGAANVAGNKPLTRSDGQEATDHRLPYHVVDQRSRGITRTRIAGSRRRVIASKPLPAKCSGCWSWREGMTALSFATLAVSSRSFQGSDEFSQTCTDSSSVS